MYGVKTKRGWMVYEGATLIPQRSPAFSFETREEAEKEAAEFSAHGEGGEVVERDGGWSG